MFMQAHNDYLQLAAEGGLLVGTPVLVTLAILGRRVWASLDARSGDARSSWIRVGAVAGLAGVAAQSLVEFSLQMPGNAALFVVLLAIAVHQPAVRPSHAHRI
jgi:O-antigen ligase